MLNARDSLGDRLQFKFGNGHSRIWYDSWHTLIPISRQLPFIDIHEIDLRLKGIGLEP